MRHRALLACCAAALLTAPAARADDEEDLAGLLGEQVVSGASKTAELARDAPATTSVITAEDIRRHGMRSISEAIDFLGMGLVTQNPLHSVEVGGRGVLLTSDFGNHVLLVVDGHVMNEPWDGTAYFEQGAAIPMELIDHIELVLGPGSVLYGGSAMFGVVNVVTKRASSYKGLHFIADGSASPQQGRGGSFTSFRPGDLGGSYRLATGIGHEFTLFGKPAELTAQAELYQHNGPSFQWGPQVETDASGAPVTFGSRSLPNAWGGRTTEQYTTSVPAVHARLLVGDLSVMVRAASYTRRTPYVNGFNQFVSDFDEPRTFERDRWLSADLQYRVRPTPKLGLLVHTYGDLYDFLQHQYSSDPGDCTNLASGPCRQQTYGHSRWVGTELQALYDWTGKDELTTMVGVDGRIRDIGALTESTAADTGFVTNVDGDKNLTEIVWAAYAQQRYSPTRFWHLNAGARFDSDPRGGARLSPRVATAFDVWRDGVAKVIYSEAFRAPTFYEAFYESPQQHPSPTIKSEVVRSLESTLEQRVGRHRFLMGVFRTWWSDMIELRELGADSFQYQNTSAIHNYGYNARADGAIGQLRYGMSVTGAYTRRVEPEGDTHALAVAPQLFGNVRASYDLPDYWPTVALASTFVGKRPADRAFDGNFGTMPYAPASVELRLTLSERFPGVPGLSYRIGASVVSASSSAYVAGPNQSIAPDVSPRPNAELAPINRFTTFGTLTYDLPL
jgi:outer membrane receptor for ferrienterochelin and colicins